MRIKNIGSLRHQVILQAPSESQDTFGEQVITYPSDTLTAWGKIEPLTGRELERAKAMQAESTHKITLRYDGDVAVTPKYRAKFGSRFFDILQLIDMEERNIVWEALCKERVS